MTKEELTLDERMALELYWRRPWKMDNPLPEEAEAFILGWRAAKATYE